MKIDLDKLEHEARESRDVDYAQGDHWGLAERRTLALIARIRELERLAEGLIEEIAVDLPGSRRHDLDDERAVLARGVVLP